MEAVQFINSLEDLKQAIKHPYRIGEFLSDDTQVFEVSNDDNENEALIQSYDEKNELYYAVNWEDDSLFTEDGIKIRSVYERVNELMDC